MKNWSNAVSHLCGGSDPQPKYSEIIKEVNAGDFDYRLDPYRKKSTGEKAGVALTVFVYGILVGITFLGAVMFGLPALLILVAISLLVVRCVAIKKEAVIR